MLRVIKSLLSNLEDKVLEDKEGKIGIKNLRDLREYGRLQVVMFDEKRIVLADILGRYIIY